MQLESPSLPHPPPQKKTKGKTTKMGLTRENRTDKKVIWQLKLSLYLFIFSPPNILFNVFT